jgi:hypothetical protein
MTNHLRIQPGSIVGEAFDTFSLRLPRRVGLLSSADGEYASSPSSPHPLHLRLPSSYVYRTRTSEQQHETPNLSLLGSLDGRFDGLDLISLRGLPSSLSSLPSSSSLAAVAQIRLSTLQGGHVALSTSSAKLAGRTSTGEGEIGGASEIVLSLSSETRLRDINAVLSDVVYLPPYSREGGGDGKKDEIRIEVKWGGETVEGVIQIDVPPAVMPFSLLQ